MWKKIKVNVQNIKHETEKAVLIAMPHSSNYDGFTFWISKKLVRAGSHSYEVQVSINDDMTFNLKRTSEKTRAVLEETTIGADEMIEAFGESHFDSRRDLPKPVEIVTHVPAPLEAEKVNANESLIR